MMLHGIYFKELFLIVLSTNIADAVTFNFNCEFGGQYSGLLQLGQYFPLDVTLGHSHNASIRISSSCCEDVIVERAYCSGCAETGNNTCFTNSDFVSLDYTKRTSALCKKSTLIAVSCLSVKCDNKKLPESGNASFADPGYLTGCMHDVKSYVCTGNGTWVAEHCNQSILYQQSTVDWFSNYINISSSTEPFISSTENQTVKHENNSWNTSNSLEISNSTVNETLDALLEQKEAIKELYNFLIAFGTIMVFVTALVCGFFIRNRKKEPFDGDNPLEYWQDRDYVDGVMNKAYHPNSPFSVNPIYSSDKSGSINKDHHHTEEKPSKSQKRVERNSSHCYTDRPEVQRLMKHDSVNKYVTTATGSNFYSYRKSPDADVTDIDFALEGCSDYGERSPSIPRGTKIYPSSSFKPQRSGRKQRKDDRNEDKSTGTINKADTRVKESPEMYAVSYKSRLKSRLNNWSAEESDV